MVSAQLTLPQGRGMDSASSQGLEVHVPLPAPGLQPTQLVLARGLLSTVRTISPILAKHLLT